jgi:predicted nucleotidyltransferase
MNLPDEMRPFMEPLEALQKLLARFNENGVIIGGTAVSILGKPRYTEDLDAMFLLSIRDIPAIIESAAQEGIEPRIPNCAEFASKNRVLLLKHALSNTNIDISLGILPFEQEMVARSITYQVDETLQLRLPTPEDLIIMKAIAHRPKDIEDIRILADKYPALDKSYIKNWVAQFAEVLELPSIWDDIAPILN